jgi:hypothetical protein
MIGEDVSDRRHRLDGLRQRRERSHSSDSPIGQASAGPGPQQFAVLNNPRLKRMVRAALERALYDPSLPASEPIAGTTFTEPGIRKLLAMLALWSETATGIAAAVAKRLYHFLTQPAESAEMVAGVNLDRLIKVAKFFRVASDGSGDGQGRREAELELQARLTEVQGQVARLTNQLSRMTQSAGNSAPAEDGVEGLDKTRPRRRRSEDKRGE